MFKATSSKKIAVVTGGAGFLGSHLSDRLIAEGFHVAARIADKQTGVVTSLDKLTADHLSTLLNEVLNDPIYRVNSRKFQQAIAKANGLSVAADLVEESLGATKKAGKELK